MLNLNVMLSAGEDCVHVNLQVRGVPQRGGDAGARSAARADRAARARPPRAAAARAQRRARPTNQPQVLCLFYSCTS